METITLELSKINSTLNAHKMAIWVALIVIALLVVTYKKLRSMEGEDGVLLDWCCFGLFIFALIVTCFSYFLLASPNLTINGFELMGLTSIRALYRTGLLRILLQAMKLIAALGLILFLIGK